MKKPLRSNLKPGTALWAGRRAQWRALGISDADMEKPKIAVVNTSSELASCFTHLDGIAAEVKRCIREAGGLPFEIRTAAPSDFITSAGKYGAYILPTRDLIAADIEVQVDGALLDGMVCLASCDKTLPGQLMAAGRMNVPTIAVICGYQRSGTYKGQHVDIEEVFLKAGYLASGQITLDDLRGMADVAVQGPGVCAGMGTANSMHVVCEALGMTLPGSAPVEANSPKMMAFARASGRRIVEMVHEDLKPRDIITAGSIRNAVMMVLALSGSINCAKHLQAIATEAYVDVDVYDLYAELADKIPLLAAIRPNGEGLIEELEAAGGARGVMKRLEGVLDLDARSVTGGTIRDALAHAPEPDVTVIRTMADPMSRRPSLNIVRGNLLPGGGIVRIGGVEERKMTFEGPARLYHSREEAIAGIEAGEVKKGDVVVLRGLGVIGGPGMAMTSAVVFALDGAGLIEDVAVITEGQLSGLVNKGLVVGEASPEAAAGGPLAFVEPGDRISIDVPRKTVDLLVDEAELARRRQTPRTFGAQNLRGWLRTYQHTVQPVHKGAVLD
ncbi:MAG TPA: dihydroxy-acid dehydratase [Xanthobacteraceae bacterium]|nr:dihydroxy-acid dehydratase [Xanthobacteraceae bacterium]